MNKKTTAIIAGTVIAVLAVLFFVQSNDRGQTPAGEGEFEALAQLSFTSNDGRAVSLADFKGGPLVINSWAVWCPFCREELPDFAALQKQFGGAITVIAIDRQEPAEKTKKFTDELGVSDDIVFLLDRSDAFYKAIGGFSMPETIFVNARGDIVVHKRGFMDLAEMREHTKKIISDSNTSL